MRFIILAAAIAAAQFFAPAYAEEAAGERLSAREIGSYLRTLQDNRAVSMQTKPGMGSAPSDAQLRAINLTRDDTCRWANDGECDDPRWGTGACAENTDFSDCWRVALGIEDDSCRWANDGECDEPGFGTGACTQGTDFTDCGDVIHLRFRNDSCETAFDGVCDEPGIGTGRCAERTDRADCVGRERPLTINDHFFGHDDRVIKDTSVFPWSVIGQIDMTVGGACTATLIGEDVIVTAAHCIHSDGRLDARGEFETGYALPGGPRTAQVVDYFISPQWDNQRFSSTDEIDGTDWALLRLDRPLGRDLGYVGVLDLVRARGEAEALRAPLYQAGYSWDTGDHLSGNAGCTMTRIYPDGTMAHDCDTTRGDSGSPFMVRRGDEYFVVATDSNFRSNPDGPFIYIAVRSEEWIDYVEDFRAGRIGEGQTRPRGPGKPGAGQDPNLPALGKTD